MEEFSLTMDAILAEAVKRVFPDAKLAIGPSIDTGFYYDFDTPPFSREDLDKIEEEIKKIIVVKVQKKNQIKKKQM